MSLQALVAEKVFKNTGVFCTTLYAPIMQFREGGTDLTFTMLNNSGQPCGQVLCRTELSDDASDQSLDSEVDRIAAIVSEKAICL